MKVNQFTDTHALNQRFAATLGAILSQAIETRGHAYLAVSGGKTPAALFTILAEEALDWQRVTITLCDDRCIAPAEKDSNERMVKENLLQNKAARANFISLFSEKDNDSAYVADVKSRLLGMPAFDAVILGMGEDGHTASLFPCSPEINAGLADTDEVVLMVTPKTAPYKRISLTKNRLLNSRAMFLHLVGENKLQVLNAALAGNDVFQMPIRAFLNNPVTEVQVMYAPQ